jgi:uncharacterized membrane protein YfcA
MQLLAGASGPLLDMFFQESKISRHQVIATKSMTQTFGHLIKVTVYLPLIGQESLLTDQYFFFVTLLLMSLFCTWVGTRVLERLKEEDFRVYLGFSVKAVGLICITSGIGAFVYH